MLCCCSGVWWKNIWLFCSSVVSKWAVIATVMSEMMSAASMITMTTVVLLLPSYNIANIFQSGNDAKVVSGTYCLPEVWTIMWAHVPCVIRWKICITCGPGHQCNRNFLSGNCRCEALVKVVSHPTTALVLWSSVWSRWTWNHWPKLPAAGQRVGMFVRGIKFQGNNFGRWYYNEVPITCH